MIVRNHLIYKSNSNFIYILLVKIHEVITHEQIILKCKVRPLCAAFSFISFALKLSHHEIYICTLKRRILFVQNI